MRLEGKVAVVTGGGSGFGEGIARRFAAEGAKVVIADIDAARGEAVTENIRHGGGDARFVQTDVGEAAANENMVRTAVDAYGGLDTVVLNAAIGMAPTPLVDTTEEFFDRVFKTNVKSVYLGARAAVPAMRDQGRGGAIIVTVSTAALRPRPNLAAYNATKGALVPLCKTLALELAGDRIRVNGLCPVAGDTAMLPDFLGEGDHAAARERFIATVPMGRLSQPKDIANTALFLASDEAEFLTGVMLEIDGGRCV